MSDSLREQMLRLGLVSVTHDSHSEHKRNAAMEVMPTTVLTPEEEKKISGLTEVDRDLLMREWVSASKLRERTRGPQRYYFDSRAGTVAYLELSEKVIKDLRARALCIVESPAGETWLVPFRDAQRIAIVDKRWIRTGR